jgi:hypothetical protein
MLLEARCAKWLAAAHKNGQLQRTDSTQRRQCQLPPRHQNPRDHKRCTSYDIHGLPHCPKQRAGVQSSIARNSCTRDELIAAVGAKRRVRGRASCTYGRLCRARIAARGKAPYITSSLPWTPLLLLPRTPGDMLLWATNLRAATMKQYAQGWFSRRGRRREEGRG